MLRWGSILLVVGLPTSVPAQKRPQLTVESVRAKTVTLKWTDPNAVLQETSDLSSAIWRTPVQAPSFDGNEFSLVMDTSQPSRFFRLFASIRSVHNIYDALARIDTSPQNFTFSPNGAVVQESEGGSHIQGIGHHQGFFYLARSRPHGANTEKLLIISAAEENVVRAIDWETASTHPGGLQIHDGIMAVPFQIEDGLARINFYSLHDPIDPALLKSFTTGVGNGYCVGITAIGKDQVLPL